jgi:hypothetical protein
LLAALLSRLPLQLLPDDFPLFLKSSLLFSPIIFPIIFPYYFPYFCLLMMSECPPVLMLLAAAVRKFHQQHPS